MQLYWTCPDGQVAFLDKVGEAMEYFGVEPKGHWVHLDGSKCAFNKRYDAHDGPPDFRGCPFRNLPDKVRRAKHGSFCLEKL